jgi:hypothetical protein
LLLGIAIGAVVVVWLICGVLCEAAGESVIDPNWIFEPPTGPPFGIVTELFRLWSFEPPFTAVLPCAIAGAATAGTAGIGALPFTGEIDFVFPCCCTGAEPPTATAGEGAEEEPVAMGGDETAFFAVEAYDGVDCDALVVLEACVGFEVCWET